jgi:hypothetical protein
MKEERIYTIINILTVIGFFTLMILGSK